MHDILILNIDRQDEAMVDAYRKYRKWLRTLVAQSPNPEKMPELKFLQSSNLETCYQAITETRRIVHVLGHGTLTGSIRAESPAGRGQAVWLAQLAGALEANDENLNLDCVILDSCFSAGFMWRYQIGLLAPTDDDMLVIGSSLLLPFPQAEFFFYRFYSELLSGPLSRRRDLRLDAVRDAFNFAQDEYKLAHGKPTRLRIMEFSGRAT